MGTSSTADTTTTLLDSLYFSAGSDATANYIITVNGTQYANSLNIQEGMPHFNGGTIVLGNGGGITSTGTATHATINANLSITGMQTFNSSTNTLSLNSGNFIRAVGSILVITGSGIVTSTMSGLSVNNAAGIVGTWATVGTGSSMRYARFYNHMIVDLRGTTAGYPELLTSTSGLVNYDLHLCGGNLPATVSVNTIRFAGVGATTVIGAISFTVNGLMNVGVGNWSFASNKLTIGADKELVLIGSGGFSISSVIEDNPSRASALTIASSQAILTGANTYTGGTIITGGTRVGGSQVLVNNLTGSGTGTGAVIVDSNDTLQGSLRGTGSISGPIFVKPNAIFGGGSNMIGTLTIGSDLTFSSGGKFVVTITNNSVLAPANSGLSTLGTLPNPTSNTYVKKTGGSTPTTLDLMTVRVDVNGLTFPPHTSYSYRLAEGMGDQSSLNVSMSSAPSQFYFSGLGSYAIASASLTGDRDGYIYLNFTTAPEPRGLIVLAALGLIAMRRGIRSPLHTLVA